LVMVSTASVNLARLPPPVALTQGEIERAIFGKVREKGTFKGVVGVKVEKYRV
jgi:hypothetical protein